MTAKLKNPKPKTNLVLAGTNALSHDNPDRNRYGPRRLYETEQEMVFRILNGHSFLFIDGALVPKGGTR